MITRFLKRKPKSPKKIGLALGSGSARGWAHIGVIRALTEARYPGGAIPGDRPADDFPQPAREDRDTAPGGVGEDGLRGAWTHFPLEDLDENIS